MTGALTAVGVGATTASIISAAATAASVIGTVVSTVGAIQQGNAAKSAASAQSKQLAQNANTEAAVGERNYIQTEKKANYVKSKAAAQLANAGGDTSDPGSQDILSGITGEGDYQAMTALYNGQYASAGSQYGADVATAEGSAAKTASTYKGASNLLSGASSIYDKYSKGPTE